MEEIKPVSFIVDLYEIRAGFIRPLRSFNQSISLDEMYEIEKYNWLNSMIAKLSDKYKVKHSEIREELKKRHINNLY